MIKTILLIRPGAISRLVRCRHRHSLLLAPRYGYGRTPRTIMTSSLTLTGSSVHASIPQSWNDLSGIQASMCATILRTAIPQQQQQLRLLLILLDMRWYHLQKQYRFWSLSAEARYLFAIEGTKFLYSENTLTKNPFSCLRAKAFPLLGGIQGGTLIGPADALENITAEEFAFSEYHYQQYRETGKLDELHQLIAVLWRKSKSQKQISAPDYDGDPRLPFNSHIYDHPTANCRCQLPTAYSLLQFYEASRNKIIADNPEIFTNQRQAAGSATITGWVKVFYALAENITGVDAVAKQRLSAIITWLIHQKEDTEEMQKRLKKQ